MPTPGLLTLTFPGLLGRVRQARCGSVGNGVGCWKGRAHARAEKQVLRAPPTVAMWQCGASVPP